MVILGISVVVGVAVLLGDALAGLIKRIITGSKGTRRWE